MSVVGVVLPGTSVSAIIERVLVGDEFNNQKLVKVDADGVPIVKLGNGLLQTGGDTVAVKAGLLHFSKPGKFWIETQQKRYVPCANDLVLGVVLARLTDSYKVDLGASLMANLNFSGFEGATKKNRPNLQPGDVVFARVSVANKDLEPELVCLDGDNQAAAAAAVEGLGQVTDGMLFRCSVSAARKLQQTSSWVIEGLGKHYAFEVTVGANGMFVLHSNKASDTVKLGNILLESDSIDPSDEDAKKWLSQQIKNMSK